MISDSETNRVLMLSNCYGLLMSTSSNTASQIPISITPASFPQEDFKDLIEKTAKHNLLMQKVSQDTEYLYSKLFEVCKIDDFTRQLVELSKKVHNSKHFQEIYFGLTRNDFMYDDIEKKFIQVEYNTISASFVALGTKIVEFHKHLYSNYSNFFNISESPADSILENNPLLNFVNGFNYAYKLYGNTGVILFVVLEDEKNLYDQTLIELEL
jgi:Eukaryotic glutathione synthase, ATP binding domain.